LWAFVHLHVLDRVADPASLNKNKQGIAPSSPNIEPRSAGSNDSAAFRQCRVSGAQTGQRTMRFSMFQLHVSRAPYPARDPYTISPSRVWFTRRSGCRVRHAGMTARNLSSGRCSLALPSDQCYNGGSPHSLMRCQQSTAVTQHAWSHSDLPAEQAAYSSLLRVLCRFSAQKNRRARQRQ
jgi:hypothetical protein